MSDQIKLIPLQKVSVDCQVMKEQKKNPLGCLDKISSFTNTTIYLINIATVIRRVEPLPLFYWKDSFFYLNHLSHQILVAKLLAGIINDFMNGCFYQFLTLYTLFQKKYCIVCNLIFTFDAELQHKKCLHDDNKTIKGLIKALLFLFSDE